MSESEAVLKEQEWHSLFRDMHKHGEWFNTIDGGAPVQLLIH
jgi:hypothetical protein